VRRWIARANVVLAAGVLVVAGAALRDVLGTRAARPSAPLGPFLPIDLTQGATRPAAPGFRLEPFLEDLARLHGRAHPERPARIAPPSESPGEGFALTTLSIAGILRSPNGGDLVLFRSKDPAHPLSCQLSEGEEEHGLKLLSLRFEGSFARARVCRGDSERVLSFRMGEDAETSLIREVRPPATRDSFVAIRPASGPCYSEIVKAVPFFDDAGRRVGVRVTGIDPASGLRKVGLSPGDVITAMNGQAAPTREALVRGIGAANASMELTIHSATGGTARTVVVGAK
jgi:hypothetical protein